MQCEVNIYGEIFVVEC